MSNCFDFCGCQKKLSKNAGKIDEKCIKLNSPKAEILILGTPPLILFPMRINTLCNEEERMENHQKKMNETINNFML